jgi:hypothetical protein
VFLRSGAGMRQRISQINSSLTVFENSKVLAVFENSSFNGFSKFKNFYGQA